MALPAPDVLLAGRRAFAEIWELQKGIFKALQNGEGTETLIIVEHDPVITIGKSAKAGSLLVPAEELEKAGVSLFNIERGGDVTWHGPGQLVMYPLLNLNLRKRDVGWYVRGLEEIAIRTLKARDITGIRISGKPGVWIEGNEVSGNFTGRKIASIGVKIAKWCTMHGLALNVQDCEYGFSYINPCGFTGVEAVSMKGITGRSFDMEEVQDMLVRNFFEVFQNEN